MVVSLIEIREVGPRDGLQSLQKIPLATKIGFVNDLSSTGLKHIEVCSLVNPCIVPQMADAIEVFLGIKKEKGTNYAILVPTVKYYETARKLFPQTISVVISANPEHNFQNINRTIKETKNEIDQIMLLAKNDGIKVRAYVSCAWGYNEKTAEKDEKNAAKISTWLAKKGAGEISIADTMGLSNAETVARVIEKIGKLTGIEMLSVHFHSKQFPQEKIESALNVGITKIDSSILGLGGYYLNNVTGNVATEKLVAKLNHKIQPSIDQKKLNQISEKYLLFFEPYLKPISVNPFKGII